MTGPLDVLHQDEHLVAVSKPSGCSVHAARGDPTRPLLQRLRDQLERRVYPVHRLARPTSGVVVMALSSETAAFLAEAFRERRVQKRYWTLSWGLFDADEGVIDHAVRSRREKDAPRRPAVTAWRRLEAVEPWCTLLELSPRTGRHHQIRQHLKHLRRPILGDVRYGKGRLNAFYAREFGLDRLALHASRLEIPHPEGDTLILQSALPETLVTAWGRVGFSKAVLEPMRAQKPVARRPRVPQGSQP